MEFSSAQLVTTVIYVVYLLIFQNAPSKELMQVIKQAPEILGMQTTNVTSLSPTPIVSNIPSLQPNQDKQRAKVKKIVDGDTINVLINDSTAVIRLIGIDTPELVAPNKPVECFAKEAKQKATELLTGKTVYLISDPTQDDIDKYGRLLRYVTFEDGTSFNKILIEQGYAFEYTYDKPYIYQSAFQQAQYYAKSNQLGLWSPQTCNGIK